MGRIKYIFYTGILLFSTCLYAQQTIIKGKVTDAESGDPIPFVNVYFKGTEIGTTTDFDGYYILKSTSPTDSLIASYIGYIKRAKAFEKGKENQINFQLTPELFRLDEFVVYPGENPAFEILRRVVKNKKENDKRKLNAYEYESYNKIELDIDNLSEKFRQKKVMKKIAQVLDSVERIAGEDGRPILPVFISESISEFYYRTDPIRKREKIVKTRITGVGVQDGTLVSQLIGSTFQEYNFYSNYLNILEKEFVSPIADFWKAYYDYSLKDSLYLGDEYVYKIDVWPLHKQDLAFTGTIWISKNDYALKQIDVTITNDANLNFVDKIKIQQELAKTSEGAWLPSKTRVLLDIAEVNNEWAGMLAKFYNSNKNFKVNSPYNLKFYENPLELSEQALIEEKGYWEEHRHDSLTQTEKNVYIMIDSLRNIPVIRSYSEIINIALNGYKPVGKYKTIDLGPYLYTYSNNNIEGHRVRFGGRTNIHFSSKWVFKGYLAYGFRDENFKYGGEGTYIFDRKPWTTFTASYTHDIEQVGLTSEDMGDNPLFYTFSRYGTLSRPFLFTEKSARFQTDLITGITNKFNIRNREYRPLYPFEYFVGPEPDTSVRKSWFTTTELVAEVKFAKGEIWLQNDNERLTLGSDKAPIVTFRFTKGMKGFLNGDFSYEKYTLNANQYVKLGVLGKTWYNFNLGYIPSKVPYQLLQVHLGNQTPFYNWSAFNLMRYFEFISDTYTSFNYIHRFEGLFFNRIPLIKKLKWRMLTTGSLLYGTLRQENIDLIPTADLNGNLYPTFGSLDRNKPYIELGYGIENIFKFLRVDAIHRINYTDRPGARKFGIFVSAQFRL
jgi:hypothetical protein